MSFSELFSLVVLAIVFFYVGLILFYTVQWNKIGIVNKQENSFSLTITLVVPVRNESSNIANCLLAIAQQSYPVHLTEVIIVDDHSGDDTCYLAEKFISSNPGLKCSIIHLTAEQGKKAAIKKGVENAKGELVITTDADCNYNYDWIKTIVNCYHEKKPELIVAPVLLVNGKDFFSQFQQHEIFAFLGLTGASIQAGFPLMCNGANLAFKKETFQEIELLRNDNTVLSGDDTYLLFKINEKYPGKIAFIKHYEATVFTHAHQNLHNFWQQRKRWAAKVGGYPVRYIKVVGSILYLMNFFILVSIIAGLWNAYFFKIAFYSLIAKVFSDGIFLWNILRDFKCKRLLIYLLPVQLIYIVYLVFIVPAALLGQYEWKGRFSRR